MIKDSGKYPVISQSAKIIDGYSSDSSKVVSDVPVILFGDHTRVVKFIDFPFIPGANGTKIFKTHNNHKYMYYLLEYAAYKISNRGYGRHCSLLKNYSVSFVNDKIKQEQVAREIEITFNFIDKIKEQLK